MYKWQNIIVILPFLMVLWAQVLAVNLLTNPGFETGNTSEWTIINDNPTTVNMGATSSVAKSGSYSARITGNWSGWGWHSYGQEVSVTNGQEYTLSCEINIPQCSYTSKSSLWIGIKVESVTPGVISATEEVLDSTTSGWVTLQKAVTATGNGTARVLIFASGDLAMTNLEAYYDDVVFGYELTPTIPVEININCGGVEYTTVGGRQYLADQSYSTSNGYGYVDGSAGTTSDPISATDDDLLYQTERWGVSEYKFDVTNGTYNVRLQFCEIHYTTESSRVFDVFIEDKKVWSNLDLYRLVGHDQALDLVFSYIQVNDGQLNITTQVSAGAAQFSALCVWNADPRDIGISDEAFLDMYEQKIFNWFKDSGISPYYLVPDGSPYSDPGYYVEHCNISGPGFGLVVTPIGAYRGWISYSEAYNRTMGILQGVDLMSLDEFNTRQHYVYKLEPWRDYWWDGGPPPDYERNFWDNANLMMGVVFAAQYFKGTQIEILARRLYEEVNWNKWDFTWVGYHEGMAAVILGASSPTYPIPNPYESWNNQSPDFHNSLYYFHWFTNFVDYRNITDGNGRNHYSVVSEATAFHRDCCISDWTDSPDEFQTYDYDIWGLTAVPTCTGYKQLRACSGLEANDSGSVCPVTIAASLPFLPIECLNAMKHLYWRFYQQGWPSYMPSVISTYGFLSLYNIGTAWNTDGPCAQDQVICFDQGAQVLGIENYRSGFVWEHFMKSEDIIRGLFKMGFRGPGVTKPPFTFETNLAEGKSVSASSQENSSYLPEYATDHKMITRWSSAFSDPQWITIDLEANYDVHNVRLLWQEAYASSYALQFSNDGIHWSNYYSTINGDGGVDEIEITPLVNARYLRLYCTERATSYGYSLWEVEVFGSHLAQDKVVTASSVESNDYTPECAVDGHLTSRWSSQFGDSQWLAVDLGSAYEIQQALLRWETAYALSYKIQVSNDQMNWDDVYSTTDGDGGIDNITFTPTTARYVRLYCTERATSFGYSIWEFEVFRKASSLVSCEVPWMNYE